MPQQLTYPGVYIEEVPSPVRTIVGVATSITAFLGLAPRGPVDEPVLCNGPGDVFREFGLPRPGFAMGEAVADFFGNGGSQALIVRLDAAAPAPPPVGAPGAPAPADPRAKAAEIVLGAPPAAPGGPAPGGPAPVVLTLRARSPGAWGNDVTVTVATPLHAPPPPPAPGPGAPPPAAPPAEDPAKRAAVEARAKLLGPAVTRDQVFDLVISDPAGQRLETLRDVTIVDSARRVDRVVSQESRTVTVAAFAGAPVPPAGPYKAAGTTVGADTQALDVSAFRLDDGREAKVGLYALARADIFNMLCIPGIAADDASDVLPDAAAYCLERRAMLIVDPPAGWTDKQGPIQRVEQLRQAVGEARRNTVLYFPSLLRPDLGMPGAMAAHPPSGAVAGVIARTDSQRGVWKAPAGLDASVGGSRGLSVNLTDPENGELNPLGVNCLRTKPPAGHIVWGARTLEGADALASQWKYLPVRRLALFLEESLYRGTQWIVFEPNDEPLWAQIRLNVGAFMQGLFRQGAFQGRTPAEAYFVRCDRDTTPQADIDLGIVNVHVGFAPLKPAEFVVIRLQQIAGQIAT